MTLSRRQRSGQYNIGDACTTRQRSARPGAVAMRWLGSDGQRTDYTFEALDRATNRFANALRTLRCEPGQLLCVWLPKLPEVFVAVLGALKQQLVVAPLFSSFGEEALLDRLEGASPVAIVTKRSLSKRLARIRHRLPSLAHVLLVDEAAHGADGSLSFARLLEGASDVFETSLTGPDTPSILHFTSGSTGKPKGVLHVHGSVVTQQETAQEVLGLRSDDVFWCTADQAWVTGTSYGIIAPWALGVTQVHYAGPYDAEAWFEILEGGVTVWYTAPTALRMLMREDPERFRRFDLSRLRAVFSVGEPLSPEVIRWGERVLGLPVHDTWFQTETGAIMISNRPGLAIRPGSMGKPVRGIRASILAEDGTPAPAGRPGHLCLEPGWPSMFRTYLGDDYAYASKFRGGWYHTGDSARQDDDGYFWFLGRRDDVINTAGHLVSPFEVESALLELPEIAESGVIGAPDDLLYEKVVAFVHLMPPHRLTRELDLKIRLHVGNRVSSIASPKDVVEVESVPKNRSGKILRRLLRARYTGQSPGDLSTLEDDP